MVKIDSQVHLFVVNLCKAVCIVRPMQYSVLRLAMYSVDVSVCF